MTSQEEQAMFTEADVIQQEQKQHLHPMDATYAIQRGFAMGRTRRKSRSFTMKMAAISLTTIMAIGLLLLSPLMDTHAPQPAQTAQVVNERTMDWGTLDKFKSMAAYDIDGGTLESAIRNDYIQVINKSAKSGPYQITIDAVTADENKLILLYTATSDSTREIYDVNSVRMTDIQTGRYLGNTSKIGGLEGQSWQGRSTLEFDRSKPLPNRIEVDFQIASVDPGKLSDPKTGTIRSEMNYSERIKVEFDLDPKFSLTKTEIYKPDQSFMLGDHQVLLSKVEVSPLMTRATFVYNPGKTNNFKTRTSISEMLNHHEIVSETAEGKMYKAPSISGGGTEDGMQYVFGSNMLDEPQSIVLKLSPELNRSKTTVQEHEEPVIELKIK